MGSSIESERNLPGRTSKRKRWRGVGDHLGRHIGRHLGRHLGGSGIVEFADGFVHFDASQRSNVYFYLFYFFLRSSGWEGERWGAWPGVFIVGSVPENKIKISTKALVI